MIDFLLEVNHLTKHFFVGHRILQAVNDLSFSIKEGEVLGLVGESGCGKSTVGQLLLRLIEPTQGSIQFAGQDIYQISSKSLKSLRRQMQMVFQNPSASLNPRMTIAEILTEPLIIHRLTQGSEQTAKRLKELLDLVNLEAAYLKRLPHELSGGQKQRVAIARALAVQPRFIVFDEPLSALDASIQAQIINLLKRLQKELGLTYLFISHDLSVMRYLADRIAVMYLGQLVELAPAERLYSHPIHPYTKALISAIPIADPQIERHRSRLLLKEELSSPFALPKGCHFHPRCPFVQPICQNHVPQWKEIQPGHFAACHFSNGSP